MRAILSVSAAVALFAADPASTTERQTIREHVTVLADDAMAGREAGTAGYDRAADYVVKQFRAAGLKPYPGIGWRQRVPLLALAPAGPGRAVVSRGGHSTALGAEDIALSLPARSKDEHVAGEVVVAGHCVVDPVSGINDFAKIDARGKIALCKVGAQPELSPAARNEHGDPAVKARTAHEQGATGIVMIQSAAQAATTNFGRLRRAMRAPRLVLDEPTSNGRVLGLLSAKAAELLLAGPGALSLAINSPGKREAKSSHNVLGWLPGTDPRLSKEMVVVTAHLDHIGDNIAPVFGSNDRIANGVMDNAIGVAAMIEAARRFSHSPRKPARGILFVAATAEESGLLGSQWFVRHLPKRKRLMANINIDMPMLTYLLADLLVRGTGWAALPGAAWIAREVGLPITQEPDTTPPSDNLSFTRVGVPTYVPMAGEAGEGRAAWRSFMSEHYHRANDDLSLPVNWASADRYATFVHLLTLCISNGLATKHCVH